MTERNLREQIKTWKTFLNYKSIENIYTGKCMEESNFSLDHFIPWRFVLHNEYWNLIPTTKQINSSKNDRLPSLEEYLDLFCGVQYEFVCMLRKDKVYYKKHLESYLNLEIDVFSNEFLKDKFIET